MPAPTVRPPMTAWKVGDRAIVESLRGATPPFEATVTGFITLSPADAGRLRVKYPWIQPGDLLLVLIDDDGLQHLQVACDPAIRRIISKSPPRRG